MNQSGQDAAPEAAERRFALATWLGVLAIALVVVSLLLPIVTVGLWDPYELNVAEPARRLALRLFHGGPGLSLDGVTNAIPTRGELGRGELPFTSIALGFRLFGLSVWAGRLPLALWGVLGAFATYWLVARLASRTVAALSVIVLVTMPLYFLQSRTMLGDIVTLAAYAGSYAGFGIAIFDRGSTPDSKVTRRASALRSLAFTMGVGSVVAGFLSRGLVLGVSAPLAGVGLSWLVLRASGALSGERSGDIYGATVLFASAATGAFGGRELAQNLLAPERYSMLTGFSIDIARALPPFDLVLQQLGHALFPWSAVLPFAAGRLVRPIRESGAERERLLSLRVLCLIAPAVASIAYVLLAPVSGELPFASIAPLAIIVALGLGDFDTDAPASAAFGMMVGALAIVLLSDFGYYPEKALAGFVVADAKLPESFRSTSIILLQCGTLAAVGILFFTTLERDEPGQRAFDRRDYLEWPKTLQQLWNGNLLFGVLALEAALIGFVSIDLLSTRVPWLRQYFGLGGISRSMARVGWLLLPALLATPLIVTALRDCMRAVARLRERGGAWASIPQRGTLGLLGVAAFGLTLSLVYYPKLGGQVSPQQAFGAYRRLSHEGEPLGLMGAGAGSASYYAGHSVSTFDGTQEAFEWLMEKPARRWLLVKEGDLPFLNSLFRGRSKPRTNIFVLDAESGEVLLVSNQLRPGETNENPFTAALPDKIPVPAHALDANLGGQLDVLGWDIADQDGRLVSSVVPGQHYRFSIYYEVTAQVSGTWDTFIHIDGFQRRYNGDHPTLEGKYPLNLCRVGDYIADRHDVVLEPNFSPGVYHVYFGLFNGTKRMDARRGRADDDRIEAGTLRVE